jgi:hypothetical protein
LNLKANFETSKSYLRLKGLKPGAFKLWVTTESNLYSPTALVELDGLEARGAEHRRRRRRLRRLQQRGLLLLLRLLLLLLLLLLMMMIRSRLH